MGVTGFLSMWLANIPTTAMMIPIAAAVLKALDDHRMIVRDAQRTKRSTTTIHPLCRLYCLHTGCSAPLAGDVDR